VEQAAAGYPVKIRGVITGDVPAPDFFVQDSTAGIYVEGSTSRSFPHHLGDLVEVEGVTGPGKFAPVIRELSSRILGPGKLPKAKLYAFSELADGRMDSQWVQVRGIVHSVAIDRTSWREPTLAMRVASGSTEFAVRVPIDQEQDFSSWIDREVLMEGVCGSLFTARRQLSGVLLYVPRLSFIRPEPVLPATSISTLLQFSPGQSTQHRVRVHATVAYQQPGNALFIESDGRGLRVLTQQDTSVDIGDIVEVFGFPAMGESAPMLTDGAFRKVGHAAPPLPIPLQLELPWEQYDGALVTTDAVLLDRQPQNGGWRLMLKTGDYLMEAMAPPAAREGIQAMPLNSHVRIRGIALVRSGGLWSVPQSLRMLVRSADDVQVLRAPSWWNLRHTLWILGITAGALMLVLAWVAVLGRRLREQMAIVRQKLRSGAVLEERNRIARELHDTLEQELVGITMQLDLASDCFEQVPRVAREAVENARRMSRHSMVEARRSVWDLRCHLLESGDLVSALREVIRPLAPSNGVRINLAVTGVPTRLSSSIEMNLLRIGQEAVANAIKHSHCRSVTIELRYAAESVGLTIRDDGSGFVPSVSSGHFGLLDMRERAQSIGSQLEVLSEPGKGTTITLEVATKISRLPYEQPKADTYSSR